MNAHGAVISVAIHAVLGVALAGVAWRAHESPPRLVDISVEAPIAVTAPPPPVSDPPPARAESGGPVVAPVAPRRVAPPRTPRTARREAPPVDNTALPSGSAEAAPALPATEDAPGGAAALGGDGLGAGQGGGNGDGPGVIDLSARAVPINGDAIPVLAYTAEALEKRVTGDVVLAVTVDPLGRVGRVTVRRGLGYGLDEIATKLAMQLRFRPARDRSGQPIVDTVRWRFRFAPPAP